VQLEKRPLRARRIVVRLEGCLVVVHSSNLRVRARTTVHDRLLAFVVFGPEARGTLNGLPIRPGLMLAVESGVQAELVVEAGYESMGLLVPPDVLQAHLTGRTREGTLHAPRGVELLNSSALHARALFDRGKRLAEVAARRPTLFERPEARAAAQAELLELLGLALDTSTAPRRTRGDRTRLAHRRVVKLAEDYALAHSGDRIFVKDLCTATGVSERTVEYAFQKVLGVSPLAYLTRLRLHRVRRALRTAERGSTTVTAEALRWGFWHFGEFSRSYKDCFGELPSETLRRGRSEPQPDDEVDGTPRRPSAGSRVA